MTTERIEPVIHYYREGQLSFKVGKELWQCPYVNVTDNINALTAWMAGWMLEKQIYENCKQDSQ